LIKTANSLDELKKIVENHLSNELDLMQMIFDLDKNDVEQFYEWYINHPYRKGIGEIKEIVRQARTNR
jgi:hypothetical protein